VAHPVLWQFRMSHFNEKARWALDHKGIAHERRSLLPGLHIPAVLLRTGQKKVPVLILDGKAIADSTRIIEALETLKPDPPLYPKDPADRKRALELEEWFDEELGPHLRRAGFFNFLPDTDYAANLLSVGCRSMTRRFYRAVFPAMRAAMKLDMGINAETAARSREKTEAALDRIAAERQPSGYLVGDRFSVADLTAAALCAPLAIPPEFPYPFPTPPPASSARWREGLAKHPAFAWTLDIYRRHRGTSAEIAA
jgi:glutathione S-transferase